ncbi:hypothetical protein EAG_01100 [Camponotus floridanus]|uniref:Uncharacterized protein n=2 Tax=Camponotus floridanus TaxID=104421 RepID=E2AB84_CAMFO|nr:hypothetical protein EAG_01100 [Camponotus floridanus]
MPFHVDEYINSDKNVRIGEDIYRKLLETPPWVEPCGSVVDSEDVLDKDLTEAPQRYDELMENIRLLSESAAVRTKEFMKIFIGDALNNYAKIGDTQHYPWLPKWNLEDFKKLDYKTALTTMYENVQMYMMCLEQSIWDQQILGLDHVKEFVHIEVLFQSILCQIQETMVQYGIPLQNIERSRMPLIYRGEDMRSNATFRTLRDYIWLLNCMNGIDNIAQISLHLKQNMDKMEMKT